MRKAGAILLLLGFTTGWSHLRASELVMESSWIYAARLTAPAGHKSDEFGYSVAASADAVVVGAPYATVASHYAQGAAYLFVKSQGRWVLKAKLTASDGEGNAFFGSSISISGDTVAVGADGADLKADLHAGAAYIFVKPRTGWADMTQTAKLTASDQAAKAYLGSSISISGDTVAVGADGARVGDNEFQGAVYLFLKPKKGWMTASTFTAKLAASDGARGDQLGYSLAMSGDTIVSGARSATVGSNARQGAAYVFVKPADGWVSGKETVKLNVPESAGDDQLGYSVAIDHDLVAAGAPGAKSSGAIYLFVKPSDGWSNISHPAARLTASDGVQGDQLGYSVAVHGATVIGGARSTPVNRKPRKGASYVFTRAESGWASGTESSKLTAPGSGLEDGIGSAVCLTGDAVVAGAVDASIGSNRYQGAAYVFVTGPPRKASRAAAASSRK